ncbi:MAG: ABC transporter permease, partial [Planctomycetota bacterium]
MSSSQAGRSPLKLASRFGTLFVLLLLCVFFSLATLDDQHPTDEGAARVLASRIARDYPGTPRVLIVVRPGEEDLRYAAALAEELERSGANILGKVTGIPSAVRKKLEELGAAGEKLEVIATHHFSAQGVLAGTAFKDLISEHPSLESAKVLKPPSVRWPVFLKMSNLMDILNMISVIAIIAIGMTMVIITTGIDLSVGSLIALSGVIVACAAREFGIGPQSGIFVLLGCALLGIAGCGLLGGFSGAMVTTFGIHPFIVTLSIMSIARGMSYI